MLQSRLRSDSSLTPRSGLKRPDPEMPWAIAPCRIRPSACTIQFRFGRLSAAAFGRITPVKRSGFGDAGSQTGRTPRPRFRTHLKIHRFRHRRVSADGQARSPRTCAQPGYSLPPAATTRMQSTSASGGSASTFSSSASRSRCSRDLPPGDHSAGEVAPALVRPVIRPVRRRLRGRLLHNPPCCAHQASGHRRPS
jgi:hypothetical protein